MARPTKRQTILKQMQELRQKVESVHAEYDKAKQTAQQEVKQLTEEIPESESHVHELYRDFTLGIISAEGFEEEQAELDRKKKLLQMSRDKIENVDSLKGEELHRIYMDSQELFAEYEAEKNKMDAEASKAIREARKQYLDEVARIAKPIKDAHRHVIWYGELEVDAGVKKDNYRAYHTSLGASLLTKGPHADDEKRHDVTAQNIEKAFLKRKIAE
ncbi:hypothetical protein CR205_11180 [Alteribacter lacisalsi]|uniref:Uncharacterized protein n=1 Tax=Alteribacter lacisalsi TaxID=2045244 RepID=A0A2W0HQD8_9BACI|nr:hypothetical protein [Alteribacter lacisalsi]PYZ99089.1 hypothetical protein CR205_11180 [Alteribacter lacisalsi]